MSGREMALGFAIGLGELTVLCALFYFVALRPFIRWSDRMEAIQRAAEDEK
jgi:hypothetical protein